MPRTWWGRGVLLASGVGAVWLTTACGGSQAVLWAAWQRVLLGAIGDGQGTLRPAERPLLFGPMPTPDVGQAAAFDLRLTCTSGPGVVLARWWYDDPAAGPTPVAQAFGWGQDQVELRLGPGPLETILGHFTRETCPRLFLELALPAGRADTTVALEVALLQRPVGSVADLEPNNQPAAATPLGELPTPGALCPVFGDVVDYYRALPIPPGADLQVETTSADGGPTIVEVTDENGVVLGGQTAGTVNLRPLLGDLPVTGRLFRTRPEDARRDSLLVLISPNIVVP
ncbi:MAG: hypothetical protein IT204_02595 [Fimbriimonadaceae bacterium]|nr:hypothetical protein [Fimbriimonadaceae bacterium]